MSNVIIEKQDHELTIYRIKNHIKTSISRTDT